MGNPLLNAESSADLSPEMREAIEAEADAPAALLERLAQRVDVQVARLDDRGERDLRTVRDDLRLLAEGLSLAMKTLARVARTQATITLAICDDRQTQRRMLDALGGVTESLSAVASRIEDTPDEPWRESL